MSGLDEAPHPTELANPLTPHSMSSQQSGGGALEKAASEPYGTFSPKAHGEDAGLAQEPWKPSPTTLMYTAYGMTVFLCVGLLGVVWNFDYWREHGIEVIVDMQLGMNKSEADFWTFMSFLGWPGPLFITVAIYMGFGAECGLRLYVLLAWINYIKQVLCLPVHDCRPFWYSDRVEVFGGKCSVTWGMPSEHSAIAAAFFPYLVWEIYHARTSWLPDLAQARRQRMVFLIFLEVVALSTVLLIGTSRMALGMHFPYQVLLGWLTGATVLVRYLADTPQARLGAGETRPAFAGGTAGHLHLLAWANLLAASLATIPIVTKVIVTNTWTSPVEWEVTASEVCEMDENQTFNIQPYRTMQDAVSGAAIIGTLVAVVHWQKSLFTFDTSIGHPLKRVARVLIGWFMVLVSSVLTDMLIVAKDTDLLKSVLTTYFMSIALCLLVFVGAPLLCMLCCMLDAPCTKPKGVLVESEEVKSLLGDPAADPANKA